MYIRTSTGETVSLYEMQQENPTVSFPSDPNDEALEPFGYARINPTDPPTGDVVTEGPPEQRDGVWYQTWEVREFTEEEIEAHRKAMIPESVTMRQARIALSRAGLIPSVEQALAAMQGQEGEEARIEWEYSQEVFRDKSFVIQLGAALGLTEEQIDQLFITASGIE